MPKISVIIPNYNHASYLNQRIDSVLNQTYDDFELIIFDDCSTDNSREVIESYRSLPKISTVVYNEINTGSPFKQWARGIEVAKGEYIWIAESDDWCELNFLEQLMKYAVKYPNVTLLYSNTTIVKRHGMSYWGSIPDKKYIYYDGNKLLTEKLLNGLQINNASAVIFKRNQALSCLPQLQQFHKHGDYFFWIQIAKGNTGIFVNQLLNYFRVLESSVTSQSFGKSEQSIIENIQIFGVLNSLRTFYSLKQRLTFYDCWALHFVNMLSNPTISNPKVYLKKVLHTIKYNVYFCIRMTYTIIMHNLNS